jgi:hypothetical protein
MTDPVAGQDVEAQARALTRPRRASRFAVVVAGFAGATDDPAEALAWLQEWPTASLYVPLRSVEAAREDERAALLAAQAEALAQARRQSVCTYCGHLEEAEDNEQRFEQMADHMLACEKHPARLMIEWRMRAEAAEAAQAEAERRAQEAEHGIARWEVYAQGLEAQVRSVREALVGVRRDGGPLNACWCPRLVRQAEQPQPHTPDCIKATRALSSSPVSSQSEPKA